MLLSEHRMTIKCGPLGLPKESSGTFADSKLRAPKHLAGCTGRFLAQYSALRMLCSHSLTFKASGLFSVQDSSKRSWFLWLNLVVRVTVLWLPFSALLKSTFHSYLCWNRRF